MKVRESFIDMLVVGFASGFAIMELARKGETSAFWFMLAVAGTTVYHVFSKMRLESAILKGERKVKQ